MERMKLKGSYYEMGTQLGKMITGRLTLPKASDERLEWATNCEKVMEQHTPGLVEELQGIADASTLEKEQLNALILYDCSYIKGFYTSSPLNHCTVFTIPAKHTKSGKPLIARNYDWLTEVQEYFAVHHIHPTNKLRSVLFTDHYVGGFGGVNEAGLACGCTTAAYYNGKIQPALMLNMTIRWILDSFRDVQDAVDFLEQVPLSEANLYLIVDKSGTAARVEASPNKVSTTYTQDEFLIATNHFQSEEMRKFELKITEANAHTTLSRLEGIKNWYAIHTKPITINAVKSILRDHKHGVCDHFDVQSTLWSWVATLGAHEVEVCEGSPCENEYTTESVI
ncbi:MAG: C45 family autoproteolytic acyltransferase/hydrolase [Promethearchaeota archaeon]